MHATAHARSLHLTRVLGIPSGVATINFVSVEMAEGEELPAAFQKDCWGDDDDYECEEEDDGQNESLKSRQEKAKQAGMIQVGAEGWREAVKGKLSGITGLDFGSMNDAIDAVKKASKATCVVRRGCNSEERIAYHERMATEASSDKDKEYHRKKAEKARKNNLGVGTGLLLHPRFPLGYIVITNCHVVMNKCEARGARITFDYLIDDKVDGVRKFDVAQFLASSPRTTSDDDRQNLDFCILLVKATTDEDEVFLRKRGVPMEETVRIQAVDKNHLKMVGVKWLPLIMFSHPRNLALRISVAKFPESIHEYPVSHIKHALPTFPGSSGANILFSSADDKNFKYWKTAFVHYRHGRAVAWQAIGPKIREYCEERRITLESDRVEELGEQADREHMENVQASAISNHPHQIDRTRGKLLWQM